MKFLFFSVLVSSAFAVDQRILSPLFGASENVNVDATNNNYVVVLKPDDSVLTASSFGSSSNSFSQRFLRHKAWLVSRLASSAMNFMEAQAGVESTVHDFFQIGRDFEGYSAKLSDVMLNEIRSNEDVDFVEKERWFKINAPVFADSGLRNNVTWGLQRISQREAMEKTKPTNVDYKYNFDLKEQGEGSTVYVVDTGIFTDHSEFGDRASWGKTFAWFSENKDFQGHGTHCAGTVGGNRFGVAPKAKLVAVKVLGDDGSGLTSWIINGINYVVQQHLAHGWFTEPVPRRSVISMSLGGGYSRALNKAVDAAVKKNVFVVVAAGNENSDACTVSPASSELALTVAASNITDERAYFSNYGKCADIFAPGMDVLSAKNTDREEYWFASGTSMATPHTAGAVAALWSGLPAETSVEELRNILLSRATNYVITDTQNTPNKLLHVKA